MKRHEALQQLSRDHHHALVVAQRLKRAEPSTEQDARSQFLAYWEQDGRLHFREEEEILLPACAEFLDVEQPIVARVLTDHVQIRHLADQVAAYRPSLAVMHQLGTKLEQHVRHEERELFPLIEQGLPDETLRDLVERLSG